MINAPISPKRNPRCPREMAGWFHYYAGYSPAFAREVAAQLAVNGCERLLDPWNGAGTTTEVACELGLAADGIDANPVMLIAAKARLLGAEVNASLRSLAADFTAHCSHWTPSFEEEDPISQWLDTSSTKALRSLEMTVRNALTDASTDTLQISNELEPFSSLAAFYYVALFRTLRLLLTPFRTSNPAWIRVPDPSGRLRIPSRDLFKCFVSTVESMVHARVGCTVPLSKQERGSEIVLHVADSRAVPLADRSVDGVLSSPPYCTRLDYAVATRPELAILGVFGAAFEQLRRNLIGAATINDGTCEPQKAWGSLCNDFLTRVKSHRSKDSAGYYWKHHLQYFDGLYQSLREIDRVLKHGSSCVLVVQDSHYKELRNDLAATISEMGAGLGWSVEKRHDYPARALSSINRGVNVYGKRNATESVIWFRSAKR